jgi:hypothetical protein
MATTDPRRTGIFNPAAPGAIGGTTPSTGAFTTVTTDGVKFPATQVPSADANTLDDYEEGAWTPVLRFASTTTGITYTDRAARYTKIGNRVFASGWISLSSKGAAVGAASITGLPFTSGAYPGGFAAPSLNFVGISFAGQYSGYVAVGDVAISLTQTAEAGTQTNITNADFTDTAQIFFSLNYKVD